MNAFFDTQIEFLKGVGPVKAALLNKELNIYNFGDLLQHYPFRYEDRSKIYQINEIQNTDSTIQLRGKITHVEILGQGRKKRLLAHFEDATGKIELVWFKGINWVVKKIKAGTDYLIYGKPTAFNHKWNIAHPEIEIASNQVQPPTPLQPVYSTTEKLRLRFLDSKGISRLVAGLIPQSIPHIEETLPPYMMEQFNLMPKKEAIRQIHFPTSSSMLSKAQYRLKFEEFFFLQLRLIKLKYTRKKKLKGQIFKNTSLLTEFYHNHLPFSLTGAQKKVIREVYEDLKSGEQMNRLIQGDVGSGKTIVSFICMLIAIGNGAQATLMAPTEILADQHYKGLKPYADKLNLEIGLLTGSTKKSERVILANKLIDSTLNILIGTHALIEETVQFDNLGLAIVDEQHRFGVAQRAKLWKKNDRTIPHILVMTATPIPRTLAMTLYGDLDVSVIDELPAGRKEIITIHKYDSGRLEVFGFIRKQINLGRQVYIVYPLIEESAKLDLKHLTDGYEAIKRAFPEHAIGILHGRMKAQDKEYEMKRFVNNETRIMVATTVIEVGVDVPNASVMVIENAERFGLAQLHQLRGRVGRGADQSYCILMTSYKLSKESKKRIETMVNSNNGFEIAEADLKLRGPGDLMGTQQSGILDLLIADLGKDTHILEQARQAAATLLHNDPDLIQPEHKPVKEQVVKQRKTSLNWSRIS